MSTVKILTSKIHRANKGCLIGSQHVHFNDSCIAEVDAEVVDLLLEKDDSLSVVKSEKGEDLDDKKFSKVDEKLIKSLNETIDDLTKKNVSLNEKIADLTLEIKQLKNSTQELKDEGKEDENPFLTTSLEECKELCKSAGYPELKWSKMKEKSIREYLFEQYKIEQLEKTE